MILLTHLSCWENHNLSFRSVKNQTIHIRPGFKKLYMVLNNVMLAQSGISLTLHLLYRVVSSAKWRHVLDVNVDISVTYKLKSMGPKILPWRTPQICVDWYTLWKNSLQHRWFPVHSAKFLKAPMSISIYKRSYKLSIF